MPQECVVPAEIDRKDAVDAMREGRRASPAKEPLPSCANALSPQQYPVPSIATAHVWLGPLLIALKRSVVCTGTGTLLLAALLPSWPSKLSPQQYASPRTVRPHVWSMPADN